MSNARAVIERGLRSSKSVAEIALDSGVLARVPQLLSRHFGASAACLVADENTWKAAGAAVESHLAAAGAAVTKIVLPASPKPKPSVELASELASFLMSSGGVPVAVGSGVINDVVKHAAFSLRRPYLCVATAASMDGYTSAGAPLSEKGFKKTIQCRPARVVVGDLEVLRNAPRKMSGWGFSDLAGKIPAGADWILADALGIEPIDNAAWPMVQEHLREFLADPEDVAQGQTQAIGKLFAGLAAVGLAMEAHGSSRPASGADHQIAHLWEMEGLSHGGEPVSHGACVAIGSLAVLQLYQWLLRQDLSSLDVEHALHRAKTLPEKVDDVRRAFGSSEIGERSIEEVRMKHVERDELRAKLCRLKHDWTGLKPRLQRQLMTPDAFATMLAAAGAPDSPAAIGVDGSRLRKTVLEARFLRSRYTILDTLEETGLLHRAVTELFPEGEDLRLVC